MRKVVLSVFGIVLLALAGYLLLWPVPIDPVAWQAPPNPGYTGPFAPNDRLDDVETFGIGENHGPEDVAVDEMGRIYVSTHEGNIVRMEEDGSYAQNWIEGLGRPLGIDFDALGNLIVADGYRGLLEISRNGRVRELATTADGTPIAFADDVDVARDGKIYFSDATTRFPAKQYGGTYPASLLALMEHRGHGRLLVHDPETGETTTVAHGLHFANGVAVSHDQRFVLVNETASYRVLRVWIEGPKAGTVEPFIENLPGFPDNVSAGMDGRYWVALASPRDANLDALSGSPFLRKVVQRLPAFLRPAARHYGHVIALDGEGNVVANQQDPEGAYPVITSAVETGDHLYLGSLVAPVVARLPKEETGL